MNRIFLGLVLAILFSAQNLNASPLSEAKSSGSIVELASGYVKAQSSASAGVRSLAADINKRRKAAYAKIAKSNGVSIKVIAAESYKKRANSNR